MTVTVLLSVIYTGTQRRQEEETQWSGCYISSPNFKFNFSSPAINLICQPKGTFIPLLSLFEFWLPLKFTLPTSGLTSPNNGSLQLNQLGMAELLYILTSLGPSLTVLIMSLLISSFLSSFPLLIMLLCEFSSLWPLRKLFYLDTQTHLEKLLLFITSLIPPVLFCPFLLLLPFLKLLHSF